VEVVQRSVGIVLIVLIRAYSALTGAVVMIFTPYLIPGFVAKLIHVVARWLADCKIRCKFEDVDPSRNVSVPKISHPNLASVLIIQQV
jgi:hypothetical protein